jgi:DNA-binding MarR family transcriptional regulator
MARSKSVDVHPLLSAFKNFVTLSVRSTGQDSGDRDLSQRQMSVFLIVAIDDETSHTVRGLAHQLNISKPAITRAIDRLSDFDLVRREADPMDRRSVLITRTTEGTAYLRTLSKFAKEAEFNE